MTGRGRSIYCDEKFWKKAQKEAKRLKLSMSEWVKNLLSEAMGKK